MKTLPFPIIIYPVQAGFRKGKEFLIIFRWQINITFFTTASKRGCQKRNRQNKFQTAKSVNY